jgi:MSHA biogenesis protein MshO
MYRQTKAFTLVELILTLVITSIISVTVAVFLKTPVDQYIDIARRAELTDIADTALRRIGRDIRTAVPNSVRLSGTYIEFLPTKTGGRYRSNNIGTIPNPDSCETTGNELSFTSADDCFEITGPPIKFAANDYIVVGSTQANGNPPYDTGTTGVLRSYTGGAGSKSFVRMTGAAQLPAFASLASQHFQVVSGSEKAVTYACENVGGTTEGTGELKRYWGYGFNSTQIAPPTGGSSALLADKISACSIVYSNVNQRNGLVTISLTLTSGGDNISLYHEIHVNNSP